MRDAADAKDASPEAAEPARRGITIIAGRELPDDRELYRSILRHDRDPLSRLKARISLAIDNIRIGIARFFLTNSTFSGLANIFLTYVELMTRIRSWVIYLRVFVVRPVQLILLTDVLAALLLAFFIADVFTNNLIEQFAHAINVWLIKPQLNFVLGDGNLIERLPHYIALAVNMFFDAAAYFPLKMGLMDLATVEKAKLVSVHIAKVGFLIPKISYIIRTELIVISALLRFPLFARKTTWENSLPRLMK